MLVGPASALPALLCVSAAPRAAPLRANFFGELFKPQPSPADVYSPDGSRGPGLPTSYAEVHAAACAGVLAAVGASVPAVEVDFPPIASVNARGDGSAKSERLVHEANADFVRRLCEALGDRSVAVIGCGGGAVAALGVGAVPLREATAAAAGTDVAIVVSPSADEQWEAAAALGARTVVVVNGLLSNGLLPHAYYYRPMTAFSAQTGGVVRAYPGAYEAYDLGGARLEIEIPLSVQGRRALPDTKDAQMRLQNAYGAR